MTRPDIEYEFQARFHCYCIDKRIEQVYIKPETPKLNGKISEWENFYNFNRLHKSYGGLTPYETFRVKMNIDIQNESKSEV